MAYNSVKKASMPLTKEEFETLKSQQFCDNESCIMYNVVGQENIKTHSLVRGQGYCNSCQSKPFSIVQGTMFFGLRTPVDKIIRVLSLLASGMGRSGHELHPDKR